jgi:Zn-finger nucleic acid-binding protein
MICPVCDGRTRTVEKYGVEIDICPDCKGVWLDRGELEKIIELVSNGGPVQNIDRDRSKDKHYGSHDGRYDYKDRSKSYDERGREIDSRTGRPKRRESWFSEIFDAFGGD